MGTPTTTTRVTPVGTKLKDGYRTLIAFAADPDVSLWEKTVQPPGMNGGDKVDNTTMWNDTVRTYAPRSLKEMTDAQTTFAYDPRVLEQLYALINVETDITINHPDESTWDAFGYLQTFTPSTNQEGSQPEASCTIAFTNVDPADGSEAAPNYKTASGTDI